jgi:hypothetical protein
MTVCTKCGGNVRGEKCLLCELFAVGQTFGEANVLVGGTPTSGWPIKSLALAVHPNQVEQANARAKRHGINVTYSKSGACHIPDRANRKKLLRLEGMHDNRGGYGD